MAGHSRSKNGVASLAYVPAVHVFVFSYAKNKAIDAQHKAGHGYCRRKTFPRFRFTQSGQCRLRRQSSKCR
jgi:hypothetical protein